MATNRPRRAVLLLIAAALALTACSSAQQAGSAATLGQTRITEQQLNDTVQQVFAAQGEPVDSANATTTQQTLTRMIIFDLVDMLAARHGVVISQGALDQAIAQYTQQSGSEETAKANFTQQGVPPSMVPSVFRLQLQAAALGKELAPDGTAEEQAQAVFAAATALSKELDVKSSPRFGVWDATSLSVGPGPDDLATLPLLAK